MPAIRKGNIMKSHFPLVLILSVTVSNCFTVICKAQGRSSKMEYAFIRENGKTNPSIKGYWRSIGNGYIINATTDSVLLYSYTTNFCYKEKNDYIEKLLNTQSRFSRHGDTITIFPTDYGDKTYQLQIKNDYVKINNLPKNCISFSEMQHLNPTQLFSLFIETLKENYAFSNERNLNWATIQKDYGKKISGSTTEQELFQIMGDVVTLTKDHHTKVIAENGTTLQYRGTPTAEIVKEAFNNQSAVKDLNNFYNHFFGTNYKNISDSLLQGNGEKIANGQLEWGSLNNKIGYISIYSFTNFSKSGLSRKQEIDSLNYYFEHIITSLKDKESIIVDVSFNFGGYDAAFLTIAGFFTNKSQPAYTSQVYNNGKFYDESKIYIYPSRSITYTKPIYLLMTDISRSAAEDFAMAMKALPNVKLVGTNTLGILSSMLGKSIGRFYSTSSNQRLLSPNGKYYEVSGVEPDIKINVFSKENVFGGHKDAVRTLMEIIEKNISKD